jgi:hypothetical protein
MGVFTSCQSSICRAISFNSAYQSFHCSPDSITGQHPPLAFFGCCPLYESVRYYIPTAKFTRSSTHLLGFARLCQAFSMTSKEVNGFGYLCSLLERVESSSTALSALDPSTGKFLEHRQLHCDPRYKTKWDTSYANEHGCLCQGIGSGPSPGTQWIAGTNTFFLITTRTSRLTSTRRSATPWLSVNFALRKTTQIESVSPSAVTGSATQVMLAPTRLRLNSSSSS